MIKNLLIIVMLIFTINGFSQITKSKSNSEEVGVAKNFGVTIATMYKVPGDPDYYFITYNNLKYQTLVDIKSFGFKDIDGAFDTLYNSILDGFRNKKKKFTLNVDGGNLTISYSMGSFQFLFIDKAGVSSYSGYITKRQFSTLFGKKFNRSDFKKKK